MAVQLDWVHRAYRDALDTLGVGPGSAVVRRFLCSDLPNQAAVLESRPFSNPRPAAADLLSAAPPCAVSWVGQPPIAPARVALWAYHVHDPAGPLDTRREGATLTLRRGEVSHHWTTGLTCPAAPTSYEQTEGVLKAYDAILAERGLTLADHAMRTWFYVQNVDADYAGLVNARREFFAARGLTPETHYIASTGIEGAHADVAARVLLDAYAIDGIRPEQIQYLHALDHLSPTHIYGVTFERGTSIAWRDRRHAILSGTASIDRHGKILHPGNVSRQLDRTLENLEALLAQAGATLSDMAMFLVYVRDPNDAAPALDRMHARFGDAPIDVVTAPVCRPGWLIEVEGTAIVPANHPELPGF